MKKMKSLFVGAAVLAVACFTSCSKDNNAPIITNLKVTGPAYADSTVEVTATLTDAEGLKKATLTIETNGAVTKTDEHEISGTSHDFKHTFKIPGTAGVGQTYKFTLEVLDDHKKDEMTTSTSATITLLDPNPVTANPITTYTAKLLGSKSSANGSFFASSTGTVYKSADAVTNSDKVDFIFYSDATVVASIGSAMDTDFSTTYYPTNIGNFATKNDTKFATSTVTTTDFDAMTDDTVIGTLTTFADTKVTNLTANTVFAFKTVAGKKGLAKVTAVNGSSASGDITITVKVQQ